MYRRSRAATGARMAMVAILIWDTTPCCVCGEACEYGHSAPYKERARITISSEPSPRQQPQPGQAEVRTHDNHSYRTYSPAYAGHPRVYARTPGDRGKGRGKVVGEGE
jgi:hypothetical protein